MGVNVSFLEPAADDHARTQDAAPKGVRVPAAAVTERDGAPAAFVVIEGKVQQRTLKAGATLANDRQILGGLQAAETVVLDPPPTLKDGDAVSTGSNDKS
jgi:hypothetical protein